MGLIFALASCSDDIPGWADPQSNDPEEAKTVEMTVGQAAAIDFANISDLENTLVQLFVPSVTAETGSITNYEVTLKNGEDEVELETDENGQVTAAILKMAVEELYGKAPTPRDIPLDIAAYTTVAGLSIKNVATSTVNVTLVAPKISANYYVVGGTLDWGASAASKEQKFSHSDVNVYDDPIFTIVIPTNPNGDTWFAIGDDEACDAIANSSDYSKLLGTTSGNGNSGTSGYLAPRTELSDDGSFKVESGFAPLVRITLNMMEYSYTVEPLNFAPFVYFIGATDGWQGDDQRLATSTFDGKYTGYLYVADPNGWGLEFKFRTIKGSWDNQVNSNTLTGGITGDFANGGDNIKATAGEGVYYVELNLADNTLKATRITSMGLVGAFNGWNPADADQKMTWDATNYCYVITGATVTSDGWKFNANNGWDINLGGNDTTEPSMVISDLVGNGKNLGVVGTTIKLYPCRTTSANIYCTVQ